MIPRPFLLQLVRVVTWPHWSEHWLRTLLTVVGVALGVSTVVAVADVSESVLSSFRQMVATVAGESELEITGAAGLVDERLVAAAASVDGVQAAAGLIETFVTPAGYPDESLYLLGVDFLDSPIWQSQLPRSEIDIDDTFEFITQRDSVVVSTLFAARHGLAKDGMFDVISPAGPRTLRIRGLLGNVPAGRLFDGAVALMDLPRAQALLGRSGLVDRVAVQLRPGTVVADVKGRLMQALGPGVTVSEPEERGEQAEKLLFSLRSMLVVAGSLAVIVGAIIAYQAVAVSIFQRRRQFALLNAVGISRRSLLTLCLLETTLLALAGAALGILGGRALSAATTRLVGTATSEIWVQLDVQDPPHSASGTVAGLAVGLVTALVSAYLAARRTFEAPTVEALRPAGLGFEIPPRRWGSFVTATLLVMSTWGITLVSPQHGRTIVAVIIGSQLVAYLGAAILSPTLVASVGAALRRLTARSLRLPIRLAADNLPRTPRRSGMTVTMITAAIGMTASLGGFVQSFEHAWLGWLHQHFAADVFVGSGSRIHLLAGPQMSGAVADSLRTVPGVEAVEPFRVMPLQLDGRPVFLQAISVDDRLRHGGLAMVEGDLAAAAPALRAGSGVLLSDNLAYRLDRHRGDVLTLDTPGGARSYRVEGVFVDYLGSLDRGSVAVSTEHLASQWGDRTANLFRVWLRPGESASSARTEVLKRLGPGYYAVTSRQFLDAVQSALNRLFLATWGLVFVATVISVIGVVNAQLATVIDRGPEIAMLRTIGVSARDLTGGVMLECGALGAIGGLFGLLLGAMLSGQFVVVSMRLLTGWRLPFALPLVPLLGGVCLATMISSLAGWIPARVASRLEARQQSLD